MKKTVFLTLALLCAPAIAYAQSDWTDNSRQSYDHRYSALGSQSVYMGLEGYGRVIHNANDCAPDRAEAVWGPGQALVGYACVTPSAN